VPARGFAPGRRGQAERTSFLKKRSKKLLLLYSPVKLSAADHAGPISKSFLLLFFKKEVFPFFLNPHLPFLPKSAFALSS
jgi:hypothetical protein